jgi:hypothetical protein
MSTETFSKWVERTRSDKISADLFESFQYMDIAEARKIIDGYTEAEFPIFDIVNGLRVARAYIGSYHLPNVKHYEPYFDSKDGVLVDTEKGINAGILAGIGVEVESVGDAVNGNSFLCSSIHAVAHITPVESILDIPDYVYPNIWDRLTNPLSKLEIV